MTDRPIVVPLDGSELSEAAVPYACTVAKATGGPVLLVTVWDGGEELFGGKLRGLADDLLKSGEEYFIQYLNEVAQKIGKEGLDTQVLLGTPADEILRLLQEREARMLVMSTHGRSGLGRWWYGSVASRLVREAPVPTMVVGPKLLGEAGRAVKKVRRILVPLNGSALAETALPAAGELADALGADLLLAQVLTWATQAFVFGVPDVDVAQIDKELTAAAERYLRETKDRLRTTRAVEISVLHGQPADTLIGLTEAQDIDLVVMASHAR
ncbi:MAG: universal stress protein, partial [Dehalococcoidia bacterium]|nr:universal stress protein [Dehalococcoidia bacterium]